MPHLDDKLRVVRKGILHRDVLLHKVVTFCRRNPALVVAFLAVFLVILWLLIQVVLSYLALQAT